VDLVGGVAMSGNLAASRRRRGHPAFPFAAPCL